MKRRKFLQNISLGSLAIAGLAVPNIVTSKKRYSWVAVSAFDKAGILGRSFDKLCSDITRPEGMKRK